MLLRAGQQMIVVYFSHERARFDSQPESGSLFVVDGGRVPVLAVDRPEHPVRNRVVPRGKT
jgi:hypothetical protein